MLSDKKLVLFFTAGMSLKKWSDGGMLSREVRIYNELAKHFDKIYFLTYGGEGENEYKNFLAANIEILPNKRRINLFIYSFLAPFIHIKAMKKADIYKTNQMLGSWTAVIAKVLFKKKLIVRQGYQYSSTLKKKGKNLLSFIASIAEFFAYRHADKITVTSHSIKDFIVEKYKIKQGKIVVIPNYVDTESFRPFEREKKAGRITFVGRFGKEKNLFSLIDAVKGLDIKLVLIGKGPLEDALKKKVKEEGVENVVFAGVVPNERLPEELNKSEIFMLPSLYEGNPKTLLEAMACRLPVIGTNVVGIKEVVKHKENGYLCENSTDSIEEAIREVMTNENLRHKLAVNARDTIIKNYSSEKIVDKELRLYDRLLRGGELR
jgi:glycosyltransferase involved in cell wall biosynthesis